ncbi:dihydrofolate reductase family protein [Gulosibacter sp. 10]|uniref:dihydrofolate reductase family protein n=1 Tax=Gulosibacter sp. 10 TaxID=1255570 RepID=UPI00097E7ED5|nr:dihydrofolate reductase family protein [Gulosibacter sp. 10]SJM65273.1 Dihydrofolate reductase [Gulosibacter sp. 10]
MGRIIFDAATTINGWIADERDSLDWLFEVEQGAEPDPGIGLPTDATVLVAGSTTYEWMVAQLELLEHPERWRESYGRAVLFVFTSRALETPPGLDVRLVSGPVEGRLPAIRAAAGGGDVWLLGGGDLLGQFLDADALDVLALSIAPAALPAGAPLLPRRVGADRLRLVEARAVGQFARVVYEVRADASARQQPAR